MFEAGIPEVGASFGQPINGLPPAVGERALRDQPLGEMSEGLPAVTGADLSLCRREERLGLPGRSPTPGRDGVAVTQEGLRPETTGGQQLSHLVACPVAVKVLHGAQERPFGAV